MTTKKGLFGGLFYGISQLLFFLVIGVIFLVSAIFLDQKILNNKTP